LAPIPITEIAGMGGKSGPVVAELPDVLTNIDAGSHTYELAPDAVIVTACAPQV
jgi:hypothetical protein